jgi:hypothetical protein
MKQKTAEKANGDVAEQTSILRTLAESQADGRQLLEKDEMARIASVSVRTLNEWIRLRKVPVIKISARVHRFDPERVMEALRRYEIAEVKLR